MPHQIETDRLVLRPFVAADGDTVVRYLGDFEVSRWLGRVPHPFSHADLRITGPNGESLWPEMVAITHARAIVGGTGIGDHLGYWTARPFWGQGIATEAASALCDFHFRTTDADVLESGHFEGNTGSARVLQKLGFTESRRGMNFSRSNGRDMPHVWVELTRDAWRAGR